MSGNILNDTKKVLGIEPQYEVFDLDILMHINAAFATLTQLGVGPAEGVVVGEEDTWSDLIGNDPRLSPVKTYVYLRVRLLFDPPGTSYLINSLDEQAKQLEWRLNVAAENIAYREEVS